MDILQREVRLYLALLQTQRIEVIESYTRFGFSFRSTGQRHLLRHKIGEVRQVGIQSQREVGYQVAKQVLHFSFCGDTRLFRFGLEGLDRNGGFLTFIHAEVRRGVQSYITKRVWDGLVGTFAVLEHNMRLYSRKDRISITALRRSIQANLTVHGEITQRSLELIRHQRQHLGYLPFAGLQAEVHRILIRSETGCAHFAVQRQTKLINSQFHAFHVEMIALV